MTKFKTGDKVVLATSRPRHGLGAVQEGDVGVVTHVRSDTQMTIAFPAQRNWSGIASDLKRFKEPKNKVEERLDAIEERLASIESLLSAKEEEAVTISGPYASADLEELAMPRVKPRKGKRKATPNMLRKMAVEFAQHFTRTEEQKIESGPSIRWVEYYTNPEKGTVVAVIKRKNRLSGKQVVMSRGMAKLSPGDTYNEYIGRAIALHRARELTIPRELRFAPNPTSPVKGMQVDTKTDYGVMTLGDRTDLEANPTTLRHDLFEDLDHGRMTIVDDTGALY